MTSYAELSYDVPVLGPIGVAVNGVGTVASLAIGADSVRRGIIFHNPGLTVLRVAPGNLALISGYGGIIIYPQSEETIYGDDLLHVNCAWNVVADTDPGGGSPLTILNFTDANPTVPAPEPLAQLNMMTSITSPVGVQVSTLSAASQPVIAANPTRRGIVFHNPGTVPVAVSPANVLASIGAGSLVILPGAEKRIVAKGRIRVNCGWNAIAQSGGGNPLTILEFV